MKAKTLGLLALSALTLALPFAANAAVTSGGTVYNDNSDTVGSFGGSSNKSLNNTVGTTLGDGYSVSIAANGLSKGNVSNTYFYVGQLSSFAGTVTTTNVIKGTASIASTSLVDVTTGATLTPNPSAGNYFGLKAGDKYDWVVNTAGTSTKYGLVNTFTIAA